MRSFSEVQRIVGGNGTFTEARVASGLTLAQASRLSGLMLSRLTTIETIPDTVTAQEWAMLLVLYDVDGFAERRPEGTALPVSQCRSCHALSVTEQRHTAQCETLRGR